MPNKSLQQSDNNSLSSIRLYETFVAKGFSKDEAKEVISDFVDLTKRTGQSIESKFDAKLDLILARIDSLDSKFTEKFESLDTKFTEKFEYLDHKIDNKFESLDIKFTERTNSLDSKFKLNIGLNIAVFTTLLAGILAVILK